MLDDFSYPEPGLGLNLAVDPVFGCWIWARKLNSKGYGPYWSVWERWMGRQRPPGVEFDHVCRRRACVNPIHGDLVSRGENQRRRSRRGRSTIDRCPTGHRIVPGSTLATPEGGFVCRVCMGAA